MKKLSLFASVSTALVCAVVPASFNWSPANVTLDTAEARVGRPLTATSVAGVSRRVHRREYRRAVGAAAVGGAAAGAYYFGQPAPAYEAEPAVEPEPLGEPGRAAYGEPAPYGSPAPYGEPAPYGVAVPAPYGAPAPYGRPAPYGVAAPAPYGRPAPYGVAAPAPYGVAAPAPYGGPGYGYGPEPYADTVIVNPVTGRWCRTEPTGYRWCWTP
jgi:hypothetical protein